MSSEIEVALAELVDIIEGILECPPDTPRSELQIDSFTTCQRARMILNRHLDHPSSSQGHSSHLPYNPMTNLYLIMGEVVERKYAMDIRLSDVRIVRADSEDEAVEKYRKYWEDRYSNSDVPYYVDILSVTEAI